MLMGKMWELGRSSKCPEPGPSAGSGCSTLQPRGNEIILTLPGFFPWLKPLTADSAKGYQGEAWRPQRKPVLSVRGGTVVPRFTCQTALWGWGREGRAICWSTVWPDTSAAFISP